MIAVQEVAVFADGANALTGLAQALGNYTPYIATNNDGRGIAPGLPGQDRHDRLRPAACSAPSEIYNDLAARARATSARGKLFDRAPFELDIKKGDIALDGAEQPLRVAVARERVPDLGGRVRPPAGRGFQAAGKNVLVAGDLNDFEFSAALGALTQGSVLANLWGKAPAGLAYSYKFNGHLQTLDHILVTAGLDSRVTDMRYVHFDNDVLRAQRENPYAPDTTDGTGISDHDPPVVTFELRADEHERPGHDHRHRARDAVADARHDRPARPVRPGRRHRLHDHDGRDRHLDRRGRRAERDRPELQRHRPARQRHARARARRCRSAPTAARSRRCGPTTARSRWRRGTRRSRSRTVQLGFKQTIGATEGLRTGSLLQDADVHAVDDEPVSHQRPLQLEGRPRAGPRRLKAGDGVSDQSRQMTNEQACPFDRRLNARESALTRRKVNANIEMLHLAGPEERGR